jgi:hypothetical protein
MIVTIFTCDKCLHKFTIKENELCHIGEVSQSSIGRPMQTFSDGIWKEPDTTRRLCTSCFKTVLEFIDNE